MTEKLRNTNASTFYCDPDELKACVEEYNAQLAKDPKARMSDKYGDLLIQICNGLAYNPQFRSPVNDLYREEMIQSAIYACLKAAPKCDTTKLNRKGELVSPFSFFTTVARFAFYTVIEREKRIYYGTEKYFAQTFPVAGNVQLDYSTPVKQERVEDRECDIDMAIVLESIKEDDE